MRHYCFGQGKWVFLDWMGVDPGYGTAWGGAISEGTYVPEGVELKVHEPRFEREFAIPLDRPWETGMSAYATFMKDDGMLRCWYEHGGGLGYAESSDGITWKKPNLGLKELNGSTSNNLLDFGYHGHGIFKDPTAPAAEGYKMVGCHWTETERSVLGATSPDGLHWLPLQEPILRDQHADTQSTCLYDAELEKYVLYTRQKDGRMQRRGVNRSESEDFRNFPASEPVLESNPLDPPDWDIYCNGYSRWPGAADAHLMRLSIYKHTLDVVQVHLAASRDGRIWHRPQGRVPWVGGGPSHPRPYVSVYACAGILPTGQGEWSTYVGVSHHAHNQPPEQHVRGQSGLARVSLREDGFISISSDGHGQFWTIPFRLESDRIGVNVHPLYSGALRCEVIAAGIGDTGAAITVGEALDGFRLEDCEPIRGDHVDAPLAWRGGDLSRLRGQEVRLRFSLYKADLYAIRF